MAGYLDQYGAGEDKRNRILLVTGVSLVTLLVLGSLIWYLLKNHHQESVVKTFIEDLRKGDPQGAYRAWGCTTDSSCSGYSFAKFQEDWASKNNPPDPAVFGISDSESCGNGVLMTVKVNATRVESLWVEKNADSISFAPYPICPHKTPFEIMVHRTIGQLRKPLLK